VARSQSGHDPVSGGRGPGWTDDTGMRLYYRLAP